MISGIIGDVIGSIYEAYQWQIKEQPLIQSSDFNKEIVKPFFKDAKWVRKTQSWTDDTLCTLALYNAYSKNIAPIESMVNLCNKYKNESIGFGRGFENWLKNPKPYASYANGSIMRIGFIPYLNLDLNGKLRLAHQYTGISHNHFDSFTAVSSFIVLSEKLKTCHDYRVIIKDFLNANNFNKTVEDLHKEFKFEMNAMKTLLQACVVLLESNSFEELLKNSFYVGGDSDTLACVVGNLSSFIFEVPEWLKNYALSTIEPYDDLYELVCDFEKQVF